MRCVLVLFAVAVVGLAHALSAQTLEVSLAPFGPKDRSVKLRSAGAVPLGAYRLSAVGAQVQVDRIVFTTGGSGNFAKQLDPTEGLQLWVDDGDGKFAKESDTFLARAIGDTPTIRITLHNPLVLADAETVDLWVVAGFARDFRDGSDKRTYLVSIDDAADIETSATVVLLDPPPLSTSTLTIIMPEVRPCDCCSLSAAAPGLPARLPFILFAGVMLAGAIGLRRRNGNP